MPAGVKVTSNGKQEPGLITIGKPPDGVVTANRAGFDDEIALTDKGPPPVLQTLSVVRPMLPAQTVPKATLPGTSMCPGSIAVSLKNIGSSCGLVRPIDAPQNTP